MLLNHKRSAIMASISSKKAEASASTNFTRQKCNMTNCRSFLKKMANKNASKKSEKRRPAGKVFPLETKCVYAAATNTAVCPLKTDCVYAAVFIAADNLPKMHSLQMVLLMNPKLKDLNFTNSHWSTVFKPSSHDIERLKSLPSTQDQYFGYQVIATSEQGVVVFVCPEFGVSSAAAKSSEVPLHMTVGTMGRCTAVLSGIICQQMTLDEETVTFEYRSKVYRFDLVVTKINLQLTGFLGSFINSGGNKKRGKKHGESKK